MSVKKLSPPELERWVQSLIHRHRVFGPQAKSNRFVYELLMAAADLRLDHDVTILPPRKFLLPPCEALSHFTRAGDFQPVFDGRPMVLFGVHPYDVAAIAQMDKYFGQDNPDAHYLERRKSTTLVACDVQNPSANVFAASMGTATVKEGFDLLLTRIGGVYLADSRTPAGDALLAEAGDLRDADALDLARRDQLWLDAGKLLGRRALNCRLDQLPALLEKSYEHPVWREKSKMCYSCGSCVMVCPSCFCFDVQDEVNWDTQGGTRSRRWDSCMLADFARVAGGHNFRKHRAERYRHRFYRKGKYLSDRCGFVACVGCGRCATACTTHIADPVDLYNRLLENNDG
ncbi:MAG: 4Fe-4S dicluster domain-containing protein [Phycisphaerae bacterium]|jgi:ferredoxin